MSLIGDLWKQRELIQHEHLTRSKAFISFCIFLIFICKFLFSISYFFVFLMLLIISVHIFDCTFIKFNGAFSSFYIHRFLFCIVFIPYFFLFSAHIFDWGAQKANPAWTFNKVNSVSSAKVKHISSVKLSTFCLSCGYFGEISLFSFPACWLYCPFLIWEWERTMQYTFELMFCWLPLFQTTNTKKQNLSLPWRQQWSILFNAQLMRLSYQ